MMNRQNHGTVTVDIDGRPVDIDVEMAEIIQRLWNLGIRTRNCCQGAGEFDPIAASTRDFAYIMFEAVEGLRAFLELFEGTELASRRFGQQWETAEDGAPMVPRLPRSWIFGIGVHPSRNEGESFVISATVRFAPTDTDLIRQRLWSMSPSRRKDGVGGSELFTGPVPPRPVRGVVVMAETG